MIKLTVESVLLCCGGEAPLLARRDPNARDTWTEDDAVELQLSYFADETAQVAVLSQFDDSPSLERLKTIIAQFNDVKKVRQPFAARIELDSVLIDLLCGLMHFNPKRRLTAAEALSHPWVEHVLPKESSMMTGEDGAKLALARMSACKREESLTEEQR